MTLAVVVPTFNEALNLPLLIPRLRAVVPEARIIVVDDGSPDGTRQVAERLAAECPGSIEILNRSTKSGRGGAVLAGLIHASHDVAIDRFCEMDADLSHQPEELPAMLARADEVDLVVGSRYLPGSRIEGWSRRRRAWSRGSNRLIQLVLNVPMSDFTNGYRIYSRRAVELLARHRLRETGYISLSEWAYVLHRAGMSIDDVPTVFINRRLGTSNMSAGEAINALRGLMRMRRSAPHA